VTSFVNLAHGLLLNLRVLIVLQSEPEASFKGCERSAECRRADCQTLKDCEESKGQNVSLYTVGVRWMM